MKINEFYIDMYNTLGLLERTISTEKGEKNVVTIALEHKWCRLLFERNTTNDTNAQAHIYIYLLGLAQVCCWQLEVLATTNIHVRVLCSAVAYTQPSVCAAFVLLYCCTENSTQTADTLIELTLLCFHFCWCVWVCACRFCFQRLIKLLLSWNVYTRRVPAIRTIHITDLNSRYWFFFARLLMLLLQHVLTDKIDDLWMFTMLHYVSRWTNFFVIIPAGLFLFAFSRTLLVSLAVSLFKYR